MHIGIVHYTAPPVVGGVEATLFHHARILLELGHQVTLVAGKGAAAELPGVTYRQEPLVGSDNKLVLRARQALTRGEIPADFESIIRQIRAILLNHLGDCDVLIGHNLFTMPQNLMLTTAVYHLVQEHYGPPWVSWHHDLACCRPEYEFQLHSGKPWELLQQPWPCLRHVTISQAQQVSLAELYRISPDDITVITPGINPFEFYGCNPTIIRLAEQWNLLDADCVFLLPVRITPRKKIERALRWLAAVRQESAWDARLIVTGPPDPHNLESIDYLRELFTLRSSLQLDTAAHFAYETCENANKPLLLKPDEIAHLYRIADALFFTSEQEGFGVPILEAGLARLPIFATDLPPFHETAPGLAKLFALDTPAQQVAQTIIKCLNDNQTFQLRRRVLTRFTWRGIVTQVILPLLTEVWRGNC